MLLPPALGVRVPRLSLQQPFVIGRKAGSPAWATIRDPAEAGRMGFLVTIFHALQPPRWRMMAMGEDTICQLVFAVHFYCRFKDRESSSLLPCNILFVSNPSSKQMSQSELFILSQRLQTGGPWVLRTWCLAWKFSNPGQDFTVWNGNAIRFAN